MNNYTITDFVFEDEYCFVFECVFENGHEYQIGVFKETEIVAYVLT